MHPLPYRVFWRMSKYAQHRIPRRSGQSYFDAMGPNFLHSQDLSKLLGLQHCNFTHHRRPGSVLAAKATTAVWIPESQILGHGHFKLAAALQIPHSFETCVCSPDYFILPRTSLYLHHCSTQLTAARHSSPVVYRVARTGITLASCGQLQLTLGTATSPMIV